MRNSQGINGRIKNPSYVDGDSEFGEYPWQVAILKKDPKESVYVCGGTLIDENHIITAAHCVKTYSGFDLRVRLGEWDVNHDVEFYPYVSKQVFIKVFFLFMKYIVFRWKEISFPFLFIQVIMLEH